MSTISASMAAALLLSGCGSLLGDGAGGDCDAAKLGEEMVEKSMALADEPEKLEEYNRLSKEVSDKVLADAADTENELYSGEERCADLEAMVAALDKAAAE